MTRKIYCKNCGQKMEQERADAWRCDNCRALAKLDDSEKLLFLKDGEPLTGNLAIDMWETVKSRVKEVFGISYAKYKKWIKPLKAYSTGEGNGEYKTYTVRVPDELIEELPHIKKKYVYKIEAILSMLLNEEYRLQFKSEN